MRLPQVTLGQTGLKVGRLGLGTAYGLGAKDILWAMTRELTMSFEEELSWMREFGDIVHAAKASRTDPKDWIKRTRRHTGRKE